MLENTEIYLAYFVTFSDRFFSGLNKYILRVIENHIKLTRAVNHFLVLHQVGSSENVGK